MDNDDSDGSDSDDDGLRRRFSIHFPSTGYGVWEDKKVHSNSRRCIDSIE